VPGNTAKGASRAHKWRLDARLEALLLPECSVQRCLFCGNIPVRTEASGAVEASEAHHVSSKRAYLY
jgi:hypothetical protein